MIDTFRSARSAQEDESNGHGLASRLSEACRRIQGEALRLLSGDLPAVAPAQAESLSESLDSLAGAGIAALRGLIGAGQPLLLLMSEPVLECEPVPGREPVLESEPVLECEPVPGREPVLESEPSRAAELQPSGQNQPAVPSGFRAYGDTHESLLALAREVLADGRRHFQGDAGLAALPLILDGRAAGALVSAMPGKSQVARDRDQAAAARVSVQTAAAPVDFQTMTASGGAADVTASAFVSSLAELGDAFSQAWQALTGHYRLLAARQQERLALARASQADENRIQFLGVLSHELRNPATALIMGLSLLDIVAPDSPQGLRAREIMRNQTTLLVHLLDELQDVTRLERHALSLSREALDLAHVARGTATEMQEAFARQDVRLDVQLPEQPVLLQGDAVRLADLFRNLLDNALKASLSGGLVRLSLSIDPDSRTAVAEVQDRGRGIAPEQMPLLFQPFALSGRRFDRIRNGLGIGLAMVRGIAELHGGQVEAFSDGLGLGARFVVRLPLLPAEADGAS